ncbi:MAG: PadR family transcriptional regulator [Clostridiaceae bacterium]
MNTLYYGLLAVLSNQSLSGYDLMLRINAFWHVPHSRIYPLLAKLVDDGMVTCTLVEQKGKPDKKVYSITDKGVILAREWLLKDVDETEKREELLLRIYCTHLLDKYEAIKIMNNRIQIYSEKIRKRELRVEEIKKVSGFSLNSFNDHYFSSYILNKKLISESAMAIKWCRWVISMYESEGSINFLDMDFPVI